ncbi:MAG: hypothetical protein EA428_01540, partial [Spirochaetaceae bacterium]
GPAAQRPDGTPAKPGGPARWPATVASAAACLNRRVKQRPASYAGPGQAPILTATPIDRSTPYFDTITVTKYPYFFTIIALRKEACYGRISMVPENALPDNQ